MSTIHHLERLIYAEFTRLIITDLEECAQKVKINASQMDLTLKKMCKKMCFSVFSGRTEK